MKKILPIIIWMALLVYSCEEPVVEKPAKLISQDKMIEMMVDIHLAEAAYNSMRNRDSLLENSSSTDFYYSVLQEYQVADSVFEKSYVWYASQPKLFERMYRDVMNQLNEMEQEYTGRMNNELNLGNRK